MHCMLLQLACNACHHKWQLVSCQLQIKCKYLRAWAQHVHGPYIPAAPYIIQVYVVCQALLVSNGLEDYF